MHVLPRPLTASKIIAALRSGADVVKVGFANLDPYKEDSAPADVALQMKLVRRMVDDVVRERLLVFPLSKADGRYPLISVFFPEVGINSIGERPMDIARVGIDLTAGANWQGMLIDTFEKYSGRRYNDFFSVDDTRELRASRARQGNRVLDCRLNQASGSRRLRQSRCRPNLLWRRARAESGAASRRAAAAHATRKSSCRLCGSSCASSIAPIPSGGRESGDDEAHGGSRVLLSDARPART